MTPADSAPAGPFRVHLDLGLVGARDPGGAVGAASLALHCTEDSYEQVYVFTVTDVATGRSYTTGPLTHSIAMLPVDGSGLTGDERVLQFLRLGVVLSHAMTVPVFDRPTLTAALPILGIGGRAAAQILAVFDELAGIELGVEGTGEERGPALYLLLPGTRDAATRDARRALAQRLREMAEGLEADETCVYAADGERDEHGVPADPAEVRMFWNH
jgi:hypothetical protein